MARGEGESKVEEWTKAFRHEQTKMILPPEIAGFPVLARTDYQEKYEVPGHFSFRYENDTAKIDFYFSPPEGAAPGPGDDPLSQHIACLNAAQGAVRMAADMGYYTDVEIPEEASVSSFGGDQDLHMVQNILSLRAARGDGPHPLMESGIAIVIYGDWQFKVRWTFPLDGGEEDKTRRHEAVQEYLSSLRTLIAETALRPDVFQAVETLRKTPYDKDAMATVMAFAEASEEIAITIDAKYVPLSDVEGEKEFTSALLTAFVAGNMMEQYDKLEFESQDLAGSRFLLQTYETLRKDDNCPSVPKLERWIEAEKKGKLAELIESGN